MHMRLASILSARAHAEGHEPTAAQVAHHAALAGDFAMAASACIRAGERCLRLSAFADALALVRRGTIYVERLADPERTMRSIELLEIAFRAARPACSKEMVDRLADLTARALDLGASRHASIGFYLRAFLSWEDGQPSDVHRISHELARTSRYGSARDRALGLSSAARCLVAIERDLPVAEAMILEAEALAAREGFDPVAVPLTRGQLAAYRGDLDEAVVLLGRAREIARHENDRLEEFLALEHLIDVEIETGSWSEALTHTDELVALGDRVRHGSEGSFARALREVVRFALTPGTTTATIERATDDLAQLDAKQRLASVLTRAAELEVARHAYPAARIHASRAVDLATVIDRPSDLAVSRAILAIAAHACGAIDEGGAQITELRELAERSLSSRARRSITAAERRFNPSNKE
jgi:hypothetical protein